MKKFSLVLLVLVLAAFFAACGGSSSSPSDDNPTADGDSDTQAVDGDSADNDAADSDTQAVDGDSADNDAADSDTQAVDGDGEVVGGEDELKIRYDAANNGSIYPVVTRLTNGAISGCYAAETKEDEEKSKPVDYVTGNCLNEEAVWMGISGAVENDRDIDYFNFKMSEVHVGDKFLLSMTYYSDAFESEDQVRMWGYPSPISIMLNGAVCASFDPVPVIKETGSEDLAYTAYTIFVFEINISAGKPSCAWVKPSTRPKFLMPIFSGNGRYTLGFNPCASKTAVPLSILCDPPNDASCIAKQCEDKLKLYPPAVEDGDNTMEGRDCQTFKDCLAIVGENASCVDGACHVNGDCKTDADCAKWFGTDRPQCLVEYGVCLVPPQ